MTHTHRIMSFNINGGWGDRANSWERRAPLTLALIQKYRPGLIGLQEVAEVNIATYREHLTDYTLLPGNKYGDNPPAEYNSILFRSDAYELLDSGEFWFSDTPDLESADWGVEYPMGATWAILKCLQTDQEILHINTHFEDGPWGAESRAKSSRLICERCSQIAPNLPTILTGDFNWNPWSEPYLTFLDHGFIDTYLKAGHADSAESSTFHLYKGDDYFALDFGHEMYWRIDWILAMGGSHKLLTTASMIVKDASPPTYPSDHYPIVSEIKIIQV